MTRAPAALAKSSAGHGNAAGSEAKHRLAGLYRLAGHHQSVPGRDPGAGQSGGFFKR